MTANLYPFGEFERDRSRFELRRKDRAVKLEGIARESLIPLIEKDGQSSPARRSATALVEHPSQRLHRERHE
ncbi:MAG: hypothetical protein WB762_26180 [Candidatus Sulfotelmatobacter sp.]